MSSTESIFWYLAWICQYGCKWIVTKFGYNYLLQNNKFLSQEIATSLLDFLKCMIINRYIL